MSEPETPNQPSRPHHSGLGYTRVMAGLGLVGLAVVILTGAYRQIGTSYWTNALAQGQSVTDVFTYTVVDANGATSSTTLTITTLGRQA